MTAGPSTLSRQNHDLQNQAIKSLFTQNSHIQSNPKIPSPDIIENRSVQVVKVREAWAPLPVEAEVPALSDGVTRRVVRPKSGAAEPGNLSKNEADHLERNLNDAINNNGNEEDEGKEKPNTGEVIYIHSLLIYSQSNKLLIKPLFTDNKLVFRLSYLRSVEAIIHKNTSHMCCMNRVHLHQVNIKGHDRMIFQRYLF